MCTFGKNKSILPYIISSVIAVFFVAPYEANGSFSIVAVAIKMFPIFYLILYMNSYLETANSALFTTPGIEKEKNWRERHQLATGVVCGLVCSIIGDFILLWKFTPPPPILEGSLMDLIFFILGTGAFAIAQLSYLLVFGFNPIKLKVGFSLYGVCTVLSFFVIKEAPLILKFVLSIYGFLLVTSLWRAIDRISFEDGRKKYQKLLLPVGLLSFFVSDFWIGFSTFVLKEHQTSSVQFILFTYYLAQGLIVRFKDVSFLIFGTGAFAIAQMCYIHAFGFHSKQLRVGFSLYGVCAVLSFFVLKEASMSLKLVLSVYGFLLVTSLWRAIDRVNFEDGRKKYQKLMLPIGLLSFLFSDLWIGVSTFVSKEHQTSSVQFILFTYYMAQGLIAVSST